MNRYFIQLAYNGTHYHGWQIQPNAITVQEEVQKALSTILRQTIEVVGAGRTDTGVHASFFVAHFNLDTTIEDPKRLCFKLNSILPVGIRIDTVFKVEGEAHARFDAVARTYHYYLSRAKEPFRNDTVAQTPYELNIDKMNEAADLLFEYTDFTSFSRLHTDVKTNNCKIMAAYWFVEDGRLVFKIKADRFLRNMVRAIVGTLIDVGREKLSLEQFKDIIEKKDRGMAGASAPAKGLFLTNIEYGSPIDEQLVATTL